VAEGERVAVGVVVFHPVIDSGGLGRRPDRLAADREVAEEDAVVRDLQPGLYFRVVSGLLDDCSGFRHAVGHPALHLVAVAVHDRHRIQFGHELVVAFGELLAAHLPSGVDLRRVVRPELLCVLQSRDPAEQPLAVRVRDQEVLPEPHRLAVVGRDERRQRRLLGVLGDPESPRDRHDPEAGVAPRRRRVVGRELGVSTVAGRVAARRLGVDAAPAVDRGLGSALGGVGLDGGVGDLVRSVAVTLPSPVNSVKSSSVMAYQPAAGPKAFALASRGSFSEPLCRRGALMPLGPLLMA